MTAVSIIPLQLRYKENRRYLHGTDIYDVVTSFLAEQAGTSALSGEIVFHRFAVRQCDLHWARGDKQEELPSESVCAGHFRTAAEEWRIWLIETARPVAESYAFDEDAICAASTIDGKTIRGGLASGFRPIEIAVALTKHLHNRLFPLAGQRWIFTKLELLRLLRHEDAPAVSVKLTMNLHNRITKSELKMGDELVGHIYFSAVKK